MGDLTKVKYSARSIAKEEDFNYGETVEIENLSILMGQMIQSTNNFIINGGEVSERTVPSMNVEIASVTAFNKSTGKVLHKDGVLGPISVVSGGAADRIDLLEIRSLETDYDTKVRAFKDPATGAVSYNSVDTKTRYEIEAQIVQGTEGSGNAPSVTSGWIKLAEILVTAGESTSILNADITNCTATQDGETDIGWTTDTTSNYRLKGISELKTMFRAKHEENGDHKDDIIKGQHIDWGAGAEQIDADLIPLGTAIDSEPTGGTNTNFTTLGLVRVVLTEVFARLIDLSGVNDDGVKKRHIDFGAGAEQIDADLIPLGTAIDSEPTGGTNTNLTTLGLVRVALTEVFARLIDLSGVNNDGVKKRHIDFGTGAEQVGITDLPDYDTEISDNTDVAANTTHKGSTGTDHSYIDQSVKVADTPRFARLGIGVAADGTVGLYVNKGSAGAICACATGTAAISGFSTTYRGVYGHAATKFGVCGTSSQCAVYACASAGFASYSKSDGNWGAYGCAVCYGVYGSSSTSYPVAGNGAYYNDSTKYLKHPSKSICISECLLKKPLPIYKWKWEDSNQRGFDSFVAPYAEDLQKTFGLTEKNVGYYTVDGLALGLGIELLKEIQFLKKKIKIMEGMANGN